MRLNQYIAKYQGVSRRQADELISKGKVLINGNVAALGQQIDESNDTVEISGSNSKNPSNNLSITIAPKNFEEQTILFYKPIFCLATRFDPQKRKIIYDFLPKQFIRLKPAGRLDYMSEGLMVLSNDGTLIDELSHPKNQHLKQYLVGVNQKLSSDFLDIARSGKMEIDEYTLNEVEIEPITKSDHLQYNFLKLNHNLIWYKFTLSEGRNNQIRKMVESFGQKVQRLIRTKQGDYDLTQELFESKFIIT